MCLPYKEDQEGRSSHLIFIDIQRVAQEWKAAFSGDGGFDFRLSVVCFHYNKKHEKKQTRGKKSIHLLTSGYDPWFFLFFPCPALPLFPHSETTAVC